ncbi:alcohol dehydrogenase catalytic domain-containing protein [Aeromicrobium sp.]|uniref:zinc-dependent alcohol dehydrogenase n=1 Tax=Aeromicrobium sp. TaxID=1871063 RepID=UPI0019B67818|nr:alcohol dehydrogenase catalytic domain-containing protein [Aeromicrobium sp.]MBC7630968.1 alcohol dehydrogenase catalytic domain-containing protein [Aeromicrobium sp.]
MRVATWEAIRTIQLNDVEEPTPGPEDVMVDIRACGICGSDVHAFTDGAWVTPGARLGHEYAGVVSEVGAEVRGVVRGDRVTVNPVASCGSCPRCRAGEGNLCAHLDGSVGGFGDKVLVRNAGVGHRLFLLPDHISFEEAAFLEPLSVAYRAVNRARPEVGEPAIVFGLGTIGQCVTQMLKARGITDVIGVDTPPVRRAAALAAGAAEVIDPLADDVYESLAASRGRTSSSFHEAGAIGSVFECSGAISVLPTALRVARAGAPLSMVALTALPSQIDLDTVVQKELRLLGSFAYTEVDFRNAFALLAAGRLPVAPLISHRFALADITAAFEVQNQTTSSIKVMIHP